MATRTIETRAIISAQDRTGNTFAAVSQKVRGLEHTAAGAQKRLDAVAKGMGSVGAKMRQHSEIAARMSMAAPIAAGAGADAAVEALGKVAAGIILADARDKSAAAGYIAPPVPPGDPVGAIDGMILSLATSRSVWTSPRATADALERIAKIVRAQDAGAGRS